MMIILQQWRYILRMGWGPRVDNKANSIIPKDKAIKMFISDGKMRKAPSGIDMAKLNWFNKKYNNMKQYDNKRIK